MNVATKEHLQNEVHPFSYLVRGRLHVLPDYGSIPAHSNSSPQGARSMGLLPTMLRMIKFGVCGGHVDGECVVILTVALVFCFACICLAVLLWLFKPVHY